MKLFRIVIFTLLLVQITCSISLAQQAAHLSGRVVRVSDGDTVWLETNNRFEWLAVRFYGVDAPETEWLDVWPAQPFSAEAKNFVIKEVAGKEVAVAIKDHDAFGRVVGEVFLDGRSLSRELLQRGLAWWNKKYAPDDLALFSLQQEARSKKVGLWSQQDPVPPWIHRFRYKSK